jgi:acetolactate synthase-1/2/3 large subunit
VKLNAPVVTTPHGKGLVSPFHPLYRGVIGFSGHRDAMTLLTNRFVDRIFVIGARLGEWATAGWDQNIFDNRVIHIDAVEGNLHQTPMAKLHVRGRLSTIFENILMRPLHANSRASVSVPDDALSRSFSLDEEDKFLSDASPIKPQRLMRELPRLFPPNTRYLADTGNSFSWATHYLLPYDRRIAGSRDAQGGLVSAAMDFASMGWAIGSAVGTALARPGEPVVCITGDGSMLMNGQEITVAKEHELTVIFIVLNDNALGMVRHGQRMTGAEAIGADLPPVDFAAFALAMNIEGHVVHSPDDLAALDIKSFCAKRGPTLIDVRVDREEAPPLNIRTGTLKKSR